jgi:hypothetical protein
LQISSCSIATLSHVWWSSQFKYSFHNKYSLYFIKIFLICRNLFKLRSCTISKKSGRSYLTAFIITGLPIFTNTEYLYRETGWERLEERRTSRKLQLFYNIQNGSTPPYLLDLISQTIQSTTIYLLRNGNDIIIPFCRLSLTRFFCPSYSKGME